MVISAITVSLPLSMMRHIESITKLSALSIGFYIIVVCCVSVIPGMRLTNQVGTYGKSCWLMCFSNEVYRNYCCHNMFGYYKWNVCWLLKWDSILLSAFSLTNELIVMIQAPDSLLDKCAFLFSVGSHPFLHYDNVIEFFSKIPPPVQPFENNWK